MSKINNVMVLLRFSQFSRKLLRNNSINKRFNLFTMQIQFSIRKRD